jgi:Histidine kinase
VQADQGGIGFTAIAFIDATDRNLPTVPTAIDAALGVLASLGLWLRRRWPVGVAVIIGVFSIYSVSASAVALIALFTVAVHRRLRTAVLVAAGYAVTSFLTLLVRPDASPPNWWQGALGVVCVVAAPALGMFVRARRELALVERERAASEQELRVAQARQMERSRIAQEIHDVLAHRLSLLSLQAGALEQWPDAPPAEIARVTGLIRINDHGALEDLREVIGVLRSASVVDDPTDGVPERPQPTLVDLPVLVDESRKAGMQVALECEVTDLGTVPEAMGPHGVSDRPGRAHQRPQACRARQGVGSSARCCGRWPHRRDPQSVAEWHRPHHTDPGRGYGDHWACGAGRSHWRSAGTRPHSGG